MNPEKKQRKTIQLSIFILCFSLFVAGLGFFLSYRFDNKYLLSTKDATSSIVPLVFDWDYYPQQIVSPSNLTSEKKETIFIGQFGDFSKGNFKKSPFGTATYVKNLNLPTIKDDYFMELPEIFSSCKVFINQKLVHNAGNIKQPGSMEIKTRLLRIPSGPVEIVIQVSNSSHYYSGMIYPPVLGPSHLVTKYYIQKIILYSFLCFFALGCALISIGTWLHKKANPVFMAYGCLCFFFSIHISYPLIHALSINIGQLFYLIEDMSFYAIISCMILLTYTQTKGQFSKRFYRFVYNLSLFFILLPVIGSYIILPNMPSWLPFYGIILLLGKLFFSLYLIILSTRSILCDASSPWLISGNAVFGFGLFIDVVTGGNYEPLRFIWQTEFCGFLMVILFMILVIHYNQTLLTENEMLTLHLQEQVDLKTEYLTRVLHERKRFLQTTAHDLKAPVSAIQTYIDFIRDGGIGLDEELEHYLEIIDHKCEQVRDNITSLQTLNAQDQINDTAQWINCIEFFSYLYSETKPYADANGIYYHLHLPAKPAYFYIDKNRLFRVFENIVLNATEHTPFEGSFTITVSYLSDTILISLADTGEGIPSTSISKIFDYKFTTKNTGGPRGLGLYFAKTTLEEFHGTITVSSSVNIGTTFIITLPISFNKN